MTGNVQIRPLCESDESEWRRMWTAYLDFYETKVGEDVYQTAFDRLLSEDSGEFMADR